MLQIKKATKEKIKLRMALDGPTGAGKTYTALRFAQRLAGKDGRILVIDSERRSASKYVGENPDGTPWEFDVIDLPSFSPSMYVEAVTLGGSEGYDVIIIDSLSHAWMGKDGALDLVDKKGGRFQAWRDVTPLHNDMVDSILNCPAHVIVTMRSKMEYAMEETEKNGRKQTQVTKLGMAPIQRAGVEYEFDVVIDLDQTNTATVSKSRCSAISGEKTHKPSGAFIDPLVDWLDSGVDVWRPTKTAFFERLEADFNADYDTSATLLKSLDFTGFKEDRAQEMYDAFKAEVANKGLPPTGNKNEVEEKFRDKIGKEVRKLDREVSAAISDD